MPDIRLIQDTRWPRHSISVDWLLRSDGTLDAPPKMPLGRSASRLKKRFSNHANVRATPSWRSRAAGWPKTIEAGSASGVPRRVEGGIDAGIEVGPLAGELAIFVSTGAA